MECFTIGYASAAIFFSFVESWELCSERMQIHFLRAERTRIQYQMLHRVTFFVVFGGMG